ncbi:MAG: DUF4920 domain-containing protein [Polyangiales bacterium]
MSRDTGPRQHPLRRLHANRLTTAVLGLLALAACEASRPAAPKAERASAAAPAPVEKIEAAPAESHAPQQLGAAPSLPGDPLAVRTLLEAPEPHLGKQVKCTGTVARVCQNAGCWLELQAAEGGPGLRVPMANHAFFIPKDAVGKRAVIEGALRRHELPEGQRAHYQSEGMKAVGPLSLEATSVVLL